MESSRIDRTRSPRRGWRKTALWTFVALVLGLGALPILGCVVGSRRLQALPRSRAPAPTSAMFHIAGRPLRVHAIAAGTVAIRDCHHAGCLPESWPYALRFASIVADPRVFGRLPIWCYVIEHPEGVFVIDTGATPTFADPSSWQGHRVDGALVRSFLRLDVEKAETLPEQMRRLGLEPEEVRGVVLTHQHLDHTGTTPSFSRAEIWTARAEEEAATAIGSMPWRWRAPGDDSRIRHVDIEGHTRPNVDKKGVALTRDEKLEVLWTPGHTPGSLMVRLAADEGDLWFVGDTSFRARELHPDAETTAMHTDVGQIRALHAWLLSRPGPKAILTAHDDDVPAELRALL